MIHPSTELRFVNDLVGYGVFATKLIPAGTITYVKDAFELEFTPEKYKSFSPTYQKLIDKFSYILNDGTYVVSWDIAKYVNHCCNANTISTGYGFEIAIRDIQAGEEITDEYGIFNMDIEMPLVCSQPTCRKVLKPSDFDAYYPQWDEKIKNALTVFEQVQQPLKEYLDENSNQKLQEYLQTGKNYISVYAHKLQATHGVSISK